MTKQPDLRTTIRLADVAKLSGYSVGTIQQYMCEPGFPKPAFKIGRANFWNPADIKRWAKDKAKAKRAAHAA